MKTREVFQVLCKQLEPILLPMGFSRRKDHTGHNLPWTRLLSEQTYETVWCQMDKWPWDPWIGSQLVVEFQHAPSTDVGAINSAKRARWAYLLTEDERREVQVRQNRVIAKIRVPSAAEYSEFMGFPVPNGDLFLEKYEQACRPADYSGGRAQDIWLRVLGPEDVQMWAEFMAGWLPKGFERFAAALPPSGATGK